MADRSKQQITRRVWTTGFLAAALALATPTLAQTVPPMKPSPATRAAGSKGGPRQYLDQPAAWYASDDAKAIAKVVAGNQADLGGWPKNVDTTKPLNKAPDQINGTFDNNATFDELRLLAKIHTATGDASLVPPINKGLDLILKSQYPTGGWPQSYPPDNSYHRYITFNDGSMARLLFFVKETLESDDFKFVDAGRKQALQTAFDNGVECILKCQVKVDGKLTVWCAQHDEKDFSPKAARVFEPVSLTANESIGIVHLLMAIKNPSPEVVRAVDAAAVWFDAVKIPGIRTEDRPTPEGPKEKDRFVIEDPSAPPMWARFYEIGTNKPIFGDRDGKVHYKLSDISHERRNGYRWLSYWPQNFVATEYPEWKAKHPTP